MKIVKRRVGLTFAAGLLAAALLLPVPAVDAAPPVCGDGACGGGETCDGATFCKSTSCPAGTAPVCNANCGGYTCEPTGGGGGTGSGTVELLATDRSDNTAETNVSAIEQRLLDLLDLETVSIKASIDGLSRQNVVDRLIAAHTRGVAVRVVADCEIVVVNASPSYQQLMSAGIPVVDDNDTFDGPTVNPGCTSTQTSGFVHNKFLVFEGQQTVWTGSTNLTSFGFNASQNAAVVLAGNAGIVDFYEAEFDHMFGNGLSLRDGGTGRFGRQKTLNPGIGRFTLADGSTVEVAFSPYNYASTSDTEVLINATIDSAASELLWATYYLTYDSVRDRLEKNTATSKRGAVDPLTTDSQDDTRLLIDAGEQVLVTNFLGSHHWKIVIADADAADGQVLAASHNFSNSSFNYNNENSVRIVSPTVAQAARNAFEGVWGDPQNVGLVGCIHPGESYNQNSKSLHRCNDAFDNDYDGLADSSDASCSSFFTCNACLPAGSLCSSNAECCSNSCHGPAGGRTCK